MGVRAAQGTVIITDPDRRSAIEMDTFTCSHCQRIVTLHDQHGRQLAAVLCMQCNSRMCVPCAEHARCDPFERKLERMERAIALRRSVTGGT